ncbi:unnamed protein product [Pleuronectes platessa]|uniref:Uncharacterized protein n=1 Tax=Pleuronectes platessa TaxID=8262 RepID=A0A9N7U1C2_PLEPL|nr:unnamed protein product [Pleuronectes platessa]
MTGLDSMSGTTSRAQGQEGSLTAAAQGGDPSARTGIHQLTAGAVAPGMMGDSLSRPELRSCPDVLQVAPLGNALSLHNECDVNNAAGDSLGQTRSKPQTSQITPFCLQLIDTGVSPYQREALISHCRSNVTAQFEGGTKRRGQHRTFYWR